MKIIAATYLLASVMTASGGLYSVTTVSEDLNHDISACLKEDEGTLAISEKIAESSPSNYSDEEDESLLPKDCEVKTENLVACFNTHEETNSEDCWNCVFPASESTDSCDTFCMAVEGCRRNKCSSGSSCGDTYYTVLNCVMGEIQATGGCTCTGAWNVAEDPLSGCDQSGLRGRCASVPLHFKDTA
mmetsp:Transcript_53262/g.113163  ORF Transcript_53262/g.113163 Transcript_53262/m.113163 type:complete len:187 (-) Transcript_53262:297-857(-)|eukprot:CAMPEP_0172567676 /NCGR_PEP_ID=MMETSP1067-20121228/116745_1 /TAXON_ID=265564 ORGANISM="Thalassiosira punctigera, Strain Tpunct2005C2" /NCGR_SAMPLE_ID=MMETSP1067 /ASSEMBLY_ACC=CAM_ASM_000444 /LENGTH=186 /DNA_ID=CAMNT_0013359083 /DNA_START=109 /DNA_END=669 /DNA_ORIENTATION=+